MFNNILEVPVRSKFSTEFRNLVSRIGKIHKVIEIDSKRGYLLFIIESKRKVHKQIVDFGFHTWLDNEKFRKYYKK